MNACSRHPPRPRWDIFCQVVDNFGDIGVCWRLARLLAREHACQVRLVVDRPEMLQRIAPDWHDYREANNGAEIQLIRWSSMAELEADAEVVVEAFGCELPACYVRSMASRRPAPLWINLEYLSAEPWALACHRLPSRHPQLGLDKVFFFPGFEQESGGLLREAGLIDRRNAFRADRMAQERLWTGLGVNPPLPGERRASLFGYENPAVADLLRQLSEAADPWTLLIPEGRSVAGVAEWFGASCAGPGAEWSRGRLRARILPFTDQDSYDALLWACDLNLVRGEDSLVRALWAGKPLLWQLYPQSGDAHLAKLEAFLQVLGRDFSSPVATSAVAEVLRAWNCGVGLAAPLARFMAQFEAIRACFEGWSTVLAARPELATSLVQFCEIELK